MFVRHAFSDPVFFALMAGTVVASVTLHELGHALAATWQGDDTPRRAGRLTLNPWVHMGPAALVFLLLFGMTWGLTPVNPQHFRQGRWGEALVSLAGPLTNLGLALLAVGLFAVCLGLGVGSEEALGWVYRFALVNLWLLLFNLLPLPPLDGFAVVSALRLLPAPVERVLAQAGIGLLLVAFLFGAGAWVTGAARALLDGLLVLAAAPLRGM